MGSIKRPKGIEEFSLGQWVDEGRVDVRKIREDHDLETLLRLSVEREKRRRRYEDPEPECECFVCEQTRA